MENKYYVPEIDEFCIGFEYETKNNSGIWIKNICETSYSDQHYICIPIPEYDYNYDNENTRVKYLDRKDIEGFGWELRIDDNRDLYVPEYQKERFHLRHYNNNFLTIYDDSAVDEYVFRGAVKNKSELKKLLAQLNILKKS